MLSSTLPTLAAQLTTGAAVYALGAGVVSLAGPSRRRLLSWTASARSLRVVAICAVGAFLVLAGSTGGARSVPWAMVAAGAVPAASCWVLLDSGRLEARGKRTRARLQARLGGRLLGAGVVLQIAVAVLVTGGYGREPALFLGSLVALAAAGWIGLVGGLAGKPRPSSWFAVALYAAGVLALLAARRGA